MLVRALYKNWFEKVLWPKASVVLFFFEVVSLYYCVENQTVNQIS